MSSPGSRAGRPHRRRQRRPLPHRMEWFRRGRARPCSAHRGRSCRPAAGRGRRDRRGGGEADYGPAMRGTSTPSPACLLPPSLPSGKTSPMPDRSLVGRTRSTCRESPTAKRAPQTAHRPRLRLRLMVPVLVQAAPRDVDTIEGLSPAVAIDQKGLSHNPRSTVGTVTEIYDYLRVLFARIGHPHCPKCGREVSRQTSVSIAQQIQEIIKKELNASRVGRYLLLSPVVRDKRGAFDKLLDNLRKKELYEVNYPVRF